MKKYFLFLVFSIVLVSQANAQQGVISGLNASQFLQFLATGDEHTLVGGLTPSGLKKFLAGDEKQTFSGVTPSQFWKFLAKAIPAPKKKSITPISKKIVPKSDQPK